MSATFTDHPGGDIFASGAEVLVCPVNCVPGVMGKGLALAFAKRWPALVNDHDFAFRRHGFHVPPRKGPLVARARSVGELSVVFVATKRHWREKSSLPLVAESLGQFRQWVAPYHNHTIAIPALGCGLGGLDWADVRPLIVEALADLPLRVMLYPPPGVGA